MFRLTSKNMVWTQFSLRYLHEVKLNQWLQAAKDLTLLYAIYDDHPLNANLGCMVFHIKLWQYIRSDAYRVQSIPTLVVSPWWLALCHTYWVVPKIWVPIYWNTNVVTIRSSFKRFYRDVWIKFAMLCPISRDRNMYSILLKLQGSNATRRYHPEIRVLWYCNLFFIFDV